MVHFSRDCDVFCRSCSNPTDVVRRFLDIRTELLPKKLYEKLIERTDFHSRLTSYRIDPLNENLRRMYDGYNSDNQRVFASFRETIGKEISLPPSQEEHSSLTSEEKKIVEAALQELNANYLRFISGICGLIDVMFFAFESECKVTCSIGCLEFSILFARGDIIQHGDIWRTLKTLGKVDASTRTTCEICLMCGSCMNFSVNFEALANIYCYALKIRMLSDYEDIFYTTQTWERIKSYFDKLRVVVGCLVTLKQVCLGRES